MARANKSTAAAKRPSAASSKQAAPAAKKAAPAAKKAAAPSSATVEPATSARKAVGTKSSPAAGTKVTASAKSTGAAQATKAVAASDSAAASKAPKAPKAAPVVQAAKGGSKPKGASAASSTVAAATPPIKGVTKDGIAYTKDFDAKFLTKMRARLLEEREELTGQATRLEDEANALIAEAEMGDVQFDDEGGEGDTMVVERERDLALSAQARQSVADIDAALERLTLGTYGYSVTSGRPIPRERLDAIPWADVLVEEKAGGLGRR